VTDPMRLSRRSILVMPLALAACKPGTAVLELTGKSMGTTYNVVAVDHTRDLTKTQVSKAVEDALAMVNQQMSNWDAGSEISRFNAQTGLAPIAVSDALAEVMQAAVEVNAASRGRFDTTVGPLIEAWGFGAPGQSALPSDAEIATARAASGHQNTLLIGTGTIQKTRPGAQVYLAAIGKGYGADHVAAALEALGLNDYLIEIGGDLYASGKNPDGQPWQIGIETPIVGARAVHDVVGVSGLGLASSGDYRNYFEVDGERFSHVIDPATGRPITHKTASATVLHDNAMLADAWATAMLTLGRDEGLEIAETQEIAVMFIDRDTSSEALSFTTTESSAFARLRA